ncbi:MAG TPA: hypothetical protein VFQ68_06875 [Streptosporangiaceae bacterium]|nr:hypothetical protein [Streptosporangiaceae bacterium]
MYDMYPWDSVGQGEYPPQPLRSVRNPARNPARRAPKPRNGAAPDASAPDASALNGHARDITPAQAVQAALDRRDNGGEGHPASRAATVPAARQGRQGRQ